VADKLGANEEHDIPELAWTSLLLLLLLGLAGAAVALAVCPWLVHGALKIPPVLQPEALLSFVLLALSVPIVTVTSGLRGILEAQQRFRAINLIRIPMSIFSFAGPLIVLPFSHKLVPVVALLMVGRVIGGLVHLLACLHSMPALRNNFGWNRKVISPLIKLGGWMTVSNIISPIMVYMDRFIIGGLLSVGAVAYYTVPFDLLSRFTVIPVAVSGVLFPAFALSLAQDPAHTKLLLHRGLKYVFFIIFPAMLALVMLAPEGLRLWLGPAFADHSSSVLRWLAVGIFINSLAQVPSALVPGAGRPDLTGKLHMMELPFYLLALRLLIGAYGIEGAAMAWTARVTLDAIVLFWMTQKVLPNGRLITTRSVLTLCTVLLVLAAAMLPHGLLLKALCLFVALPGFGLLAWMVALSIEERTAIMGFLSLSSSQKLDERAGIP
jgi:O-antigen/teichoic acid export membrane protein